MADLLIKGIRELTAPHTIHVSNVGLNGVKDGFKAWDSAVGCAYEVVEVPTHGRLIDADRALGRMWNALYALEDKREEQHGLDVMERANIQDGFEAGQRVVADAPTVIEASEGGEQDGKL